MSILHRALAATTIVLVAGFGITACSSTDTAPKTDKGSSAEQQPTEPKADEALTADNFTQRMNEAQIKAGTAHFEQKITVEGVGDMVMSGEMQAGSTPDETRMRMVGDMSGIAMEMLVVDGDAYMKLGELTENKFVKMGADGAMSDITAGADLNAQLKLFKESLVDFTQDGSEKIDGVDAKRYVLTLDTEKVLASSSGEEIPADAVDALGDTMTYEIFIGSDDLPRKITMDVAGSPMEMTFSKWGEPVDIQAPAADEISDRELPF